MRSLTMNFGFEFIVVLVVEIVVHVVEKFVRAWTDFLSLMHLFFKMLAEETTSNAKLCVID